MLSIEQLETLYDENKASLKSLLDSRMPSDYNARLARSHERSRLIRENCSIAEELQKRARNALGSQLRAMIDRGE